MGERLLLPRLLAQLADLQLSRGRRAEASELLQEADDILEGLLTNASSPWVRGRILGSMDAVVSARIRLEGERAGSDPARLFAVLERARARSLVDLLHSRPLSEIQTAHGPPRRRAQDHDTSDAVASNDEPRGPTTLARRDLPCRGSVGAYDDGAVRSVAHKRAAPVTIRAVQAALRPDEVLYEVALGEPASFGIVVTRSTARTLYGCPRGRRSWLRPTLWCPLRGAERTSHRRRRLSEARS